MVIIQIPGRLSKTISHLFTQAITEHRKIFEKIIRKDRKLFTCDMVEKEDGDLAPLALSLAETEATESLSPRSDMVSDSLSISMLSSG